MIQDTAAIAPSDDAVMIWYASFLTMSPAAYIPFILVLLASSTLIYPFSSKISRFFRNFVAGSYPINMKHAFTYRSLSSLSVFSVTYSSLSFLPWNSFFFSFSSFYFLIFFLKTNMYWWFTEEPEPSLKKTWHPKKKKNIF